MATKKRVIKKADLGIGYKVFNPDWTCYNFQYKVGKDYQHKGLVEICMSGFHFCENLIDCFNYYDWNPNNKVAIIHYDKSLIVQKQGDKLCSEFIRIVKEIDWNEVYKLCNLGLNNTGNRNSGDYNSGNRNSGNRNSGDYNSGGYNSGNRNSGDYNSGGYNSGNRNSGNRNSGGYNSGDYNSGDYNSGYFNTTEPKVRIFNIDTELTFDEAYQTKWHKFFRNLRFNKTEFIFSADMSDAEKEKYAYHETLGGYLRTLNYKEAWKKAIPEVTQEIKEICESIPNWNADLFFEITGVEVK